MKKLALIIFTIILVATMMLAFTGCASATTQDKLRSVWQPYEKYVYSVEGGDQTGTYTVEVIYNNNPTITLGEMTVESVNEGYILKSKLEIANVVYETACYMQKTKGSKLFVPIASYTMKNDGEYVNKVAGKYTDNKFNYTITEFGAPREESISIKAPCYDNSQIHQLLRAVDTLGTSLSFNFYVPLASENELVSLTASCSVTSEINWGDEQTTTCNKVYLSRQTKVNGASHILYYSAKPVKVDGSDLKNVLIRFDEPVGSDEFVTYTLQSISLVPNAQ